MIKVWLKQVDRAWTLEIIVHKALLLLLVFGVYSTCAVSNESDNENYSTVEEHTTCDHIIPKFIEQIMKQNTSSCDKSGEFPKPGNCSVFFKCVQSDSDAVIQPFIEYCAVGYNFVNNVCVRSTNSSDCPQYTCRIPDVANGIGNEIEGNGETSGNGNNFQSLPLVVPPSTPAVVILEVISSTTTTSEETFAEEPWTTDTSGGQMGLHETSMQMTQLENNSAGSHTLHNNLIISLCVLIILSNTH